MTSTSKAIRATALVVAFSLLLTLTAFLLRLLLYAGHSEVYEPISACASYPVIIIDAGHGGEDGGTQSAAGLLEKDVNLDIALRLASLMKQFGCEVVLTREDDRMLYTENIKGTKKTQDLRSRWEIAKQYPSSLFVSIHANSFPKPKYSGVQVYWSPNDRASENAAQLIRTAVREYLQPENERETKRADSKIYLLDRITTPAVLVETGFLSNPEEAAMLGDAQYRARVAAVICKALCDYITAVGTTNEMKGT